MEYRVVVCSCLDANILVRAQCANMALMAMEEETSSAIHPHRKANHVAQPHWTHLLIDEVISPPLINLANTDADSMQKAAQGSEPELLIPISAVLPLRSNTAEKTFMPQLTLCGDINQRNFDSIKRQ
jgi:hypothetical protein